MSVQSRINENEELLNEWSNILESPDWNSTEKQTKSMICRKKLHENLGSLAKQVEYQITKQKESKAKTNNTNNINNSNNAPAISTAGPSLGNKPISIDLSKHSDNQSAEVKEFN